jgi:hypothetical protein
LTFSPLRIFPSGKQNLGRKLELLCAALTLTGGYEMVLELSDKERDVLVHHWHLQDNESFFAFVLIGGLGTPTIKDLRDTYSRLVEEGLMESGPHDFVKTVEYETGAIGAERAYKLTDEGEKVALNLVRTEPLS